MSTHVRSSIYFLPDYLQWNSGRIKKMGWSNTEDLLFVQDDGVVIVYDYFLNFKRTFGMGQVSV